MGATTRKHPIGLYVIRGSAQNSGFLFGRVIQTLLSADGLRARYNAEIVEMPKSVRKLNVDLIGAELEQCFAQDITVLQVWRTKAGKLMAEIETALGRRE